jgi:hypothetical protein
MTERKVTNVTDELTRLQLVIAAPCMCTLICVLQTSPTSPTAMQGVRQTGASPVKVLLQEKQSCCSTFAFCSAQSLAVSPMRVYGQASKTYLSMARARSLISNIQVPRLAVLGDPRSGRSALLTFLTLNIWPAKATEGRAVEVTFQPGESANQFTDVSTKQCLMCR